MSSTMGRPPEARRETLAAVRELAAAGETDRADGGVPTAAICDRVDRGRKAVRKHCRKLTDAGKLRQVRGIGPHGPRDSYLPADGGDA